MGISLRELIELRVWEDRADQVFGSDEGEKSTLVRKVVLPTTDPRLQRVAALEHEWRTRGRSFVASWRLLREYSPDEIGRATMFRLSVTAVFEPAGEECDTRYDETGVCPVCRAGRKQVSDLIVDLRKVPKRSDIAGTYIGGEWMVSQRVAEALVDEALTGFVLRPVQHVRFAKEEGVSWSDVPSGRALLSQAAAVGLAAPDWRFAIWLNRAEQANLLMAAREEWYGPKRAARHNTFAPYYQPVITSSPIPVSSKSVFGESPFEGGNPYACPMGDTLGHSLLSELYVNCGAWDGSDLARTAQYYGFESGYHRPDPFVLISARMRQLVEKLDVKGLSLDVTHCDDGAEVSR